MKRFERSNGLDTALYKNYLYLLHVNKLYSATHLFFFTKFCNRLESHGVYDGVTYV